MSTVLKPYSDYKPMDAPWCSQVPVHWNSKRLGSVLKERGEVNHDYAEQNVLSVMRDIGVIPYADKGNVGNKKSEDIARYKIVCPHDIVLNSMNVIIGSVGRSRYQGCLSPVYYVLTPRGSELSPEFAESIFQVKPFQQSLVRIGYGILAHRMRIPMELLKSEVLPLPPPEEQAQIVRFIRHLDQRVNRLIKTKRRLIELLNEQKQAIIHRAVTRGLEPTVPLKPSGIDWLGDVPEHWTIRKVSRTFKTTGSGTTPSTGNRAYYDEGEIPWVITGDLKNCELQTTSKFVTQLALQDCSALKMFPAGSVIVAMYGATIGKVGLLRIPACVNQACCVLADSPFMSPEYVAQLFVAFRDDIVRLGVGGGQPNISQDIIKQLRLPVPPLDEQAVILKVVGESTLGFDKATSKASSEIDFIREFRTRLVADVVTGQLDVRHLDLPEVEESLIEAIDADSPEDSELPDEEAED